MPEITLLLIGQECETALFGPLQMRACSPRQWPGWVSALWRRKQTLFPPPPQPGDLVKLICMEIYMRCSHLSSKSKALHLLINSINVVLTLFIWLSVPGDGFTYTLNVFLSYLRVMLYLTASGYLVATQAIKEASFPHTYTPGNTVAAGDQYGGPWQEGPTL